MFYLHYPRGVQTFNHRSWISDDINNPIRCIFLLRNIFITIARKGTSSWSGKNKGWAINGTAFNNSNEIMLIDINFVYAVADDRIHRIKDTVFIILLNTMSIIADEKETTRK